MAQLDLFPGSKFTLDTLVDICEAHEREYGSAPKRHIMTRRGYDELVADLPPGALLHATKHGLPIFNGVEIEVYDPS